ncbi:MAG: DUF63 family protein [archaeon]
MDLAEMINEYFVKPVYNPEVQGYNLVNTAVYGILLLVISFFVVYPQLDKRGIKFNYKFALALMPYILLGTALRAINAFELLGDLVKKTMNPFELGYWTYTPGVWFLVFAVVVIGLLLAKWLEKNKKIDFYKAIAGWGILAAIIPAFIVFSNFKSFDHFGINVIAILAITGFVVLIANNIAKIKILRDKMNIFALAGQAIDGFTAYYAISYLGFGEQHVLSSMILYNTPLIFIFVKIILILLILHYVEKEIMDENLKGFIKIFLIILGFATGGASLLKIGLA